MLSFSKYTADAYFSYVFQQQRHGQLECVARCNKRRFYIEKLNYVVLRLYYVNPRTVYKRYGELGKVQIHEPENNI